mgnify:CR=1 FL=1
MDFTIQTDKRMPHNRPDIVVVNKSKRMCHIIDVAYSGDSRIALNEKEKLNKYQDLALEIKTYWRMHKVCITPVVIGALGSYTERWETFLDEIHVGLTTDIM